MRTRRRERVVNTRWRERGTGYHRARCVQLRNDRMICKYDPENPVLLQKTISSGGKKWGTYNLPDSPMDNISSWFPPNTSVYTFSTTQTEVVSILQYAMHLTLSHSHTCTHTISCLTSTTTVRCSFFTNLSILPHKTVNFKHGHFQRCVL